MPVKKITKKTIKKIKSLCCVSNKKKRTTIIIIAILIVLALFYFFRSFLVVAFVNGKPISRWALDRELERVGGQQILNTKIAEMLVFQEAKKQKVSVSEAELNSEVKKLEDNFKAQGQTLDDILALQGQSRKEFLRQIQLQLLVEKMLGKDIQVTEEEIADYFEENKALFEKGATLESQKEEIKKTLANNKLSEKIQPWLQDLQSKAKIIYFVEF